ncbi:MAG TPA: hypothetical protein DHW82_01395 [Spirochaetia bacterium]|nr:hypothetical protein [Spirochaetia bacterium]
MLKLKYIIFAVLGFLAVFGFFNFYEFQKTTSQDNEKEIVWIEKPSFMLLKDLKSQNPVLRREAIVKLGEKRVKNAVKPLFEILFSASYPLYEKQLAAKSIAMISGEEIISLCLKILTHYKDNSSKEVILSMLSILKNLEIKDLNLAEYDFSILSTILSSAGSNDIILTTIEAVENLKYVKAFYQLEKIYNRNLLYKVSVLKAMTRLVLTEPQLENWFEKFLSKIIAVETHDEVKKTIREALFTLIFDRYADKKEKVLIGLISDLTSSSFKTVLETELKMKELNFIKTEKDIIKFFLKDSDPVLVNRLTGILADKKITGISKELIDVIKNRLSGPKETRDIAIDSAKKALLTLGKTAISQEEVSFILSYFQDYYLGDSALEATLFLYERGREIDLIEKKLASYQISSLPHNQKNQFFSYFKLLIESKNKDKIEKILRYSEPYIRYNALNICLNENILGKEEIKSYFKNKDTLAAKIIEHYE